MRFFLFTYFLALLLPTLAGNFNVVHLAADQELTIEVQCDKRSQLFVLKPGQDSGTFALPEKEAVFRVKDRELREWKAAPNRAGRLVIVYQKENKLHWHTVTSQAVKNRSSLRLLNVTDQIIQLTAAGQAVELSAGQDYDLGVVDQNNLAITLPGQKRQSTKSEDPTAFVAVIYPTAEGPRLRFIADR